MLLGIWSEPSFIDNIYSNKKVFNINDKKLKEILTSCHPNTDLAHLIKQNVSSNGRI